MAFHTTTSSPNSVQHRKPCSTPAPETQRNTPYSVPPAASSSPVLPQKEGMTAAGRSSKSISARKRVTTMDSTLVMSSDASSE